MKKISKAVALILTLALMLTILAACGGGTTTQSQAPQTSAPETGAPESSAPSGAAQDPVTLQWAFTPPSGSMDEKWHMHIGDLISEYTSGAVTYEYYPNSTLGTEKVALEGVLSGTITQASISPNVIATVLPEFNILCLPFAFDSLEHFNKVISSDEYYEKMNEVANAVGLQYLGVDLAIPRNISTDKPVYTPADANGEVLRVMDGSIYTDMMALWGFGSSVISYGEVYTALQQGVVDGVENSNDGNLTMKFYEVVDYTTNTYHVYHGQHAVMNLDVWNSLTKETQESIRQAWKDTYPALLEELVPYVQEASDSIAEKGVTIIDLDEEQRQAWIDASQPLYEKYSGVIGEDFYNWFMEFVDSMR